MFSKVRFVVSKNLQARLDGNEFPSVFPKALMLIGRMLSRENGIHGAYPKFQNETLLNLAFNTSRVEVYIDTDDEHRDEAKVFVTMYCKKQNKPVQKLFFRIDKYGETWYIADLPIS